MDFRLMLRAHALSGGANARAPVMQSSQVELGWSYHFAAYQYMPSALLYNWLTLRLLINVMPPPAF